MGLGFRGTLPGVPIIRILVFWGLDPGPRIFGNYHISLLYQNLKPVSKGGTRCEECRQARTVFPGAFSDGYTLLRALCLGWCGGNLAPPYIIHQSYIP